MWYRFSSLVQYIFTRISLVCESPRTTPQSDGLSGYLACLTIVQSDNTVNASNRRTDQCLEEYTRVRKVEGEIRKMEYWARGFGCSDEIWWKRRIKSKREGRLQRNRMTSNHLLYSSIRIITALFGLPVPSRWLFLRLFLSYFLCCSNLQLPWYA